ncbi:BTB/POZ domain-containing protein 3-like [Macrosteles quadrilineatus]|uniref:BTB/POZ domain-containing protein 3-like n=2 Tax=Macrosteles quadrilineatus TaxID=74068 RepID=UPI0023E1A928|nr:BTB/POZ domain-containing protein 3-like [Macrosteles quadrilineatus]
MKRSCTSEGEENVEKKSKEDEEISEDQSSSSSNQLKNVLDGGGENVDSKPSSNDEEDKTKTDTAQTNEGISEGISEDQAKPTSSENTTSTTVPDNTTQEEDCVEVKEEEKSGEKTSPQRWQLAPTTTRQRLNYLLTTSKLSDCVVQVGKAEAQQDFKLHSVILAMSSPEFEDLLSESLNISLPDVEPDVFRQILEYIYLDYVNLWNVEKTQALYRASVKFKLPHLCEKAVEYMMAKMSLDSIWPILEAAIATQDQILTDECNKFFKKNITNLLKHPKFPTVDSSVVSSLVADNGLGVEEADLVLGVLRWAHQKCLDMEVVPNQENKRSMLLPGTISKLRFLSLSKEFFVSQVAYSKSKGDESVLTMDESYAILMNMVVPGSYPMPEGFSISTKQRTMVELKRLIRRLFNPLGTYQAVTPQSPRLDKLTVLPGPALTAPFGCKNFALDLLVSKDITLYGIQVPTFFPGMMGAAPKLYEETYIVSIQNASKPNKPMVGSINYSGKVAYNSFVDLHFKESVKLEKNNTYTVIVYTNNTYYLNQKMCTVEESFGIKFSLKDSVSLFGKPGKHDFAFISQLIYSV